MVLSPGFQRRARENLAPLPRQRTLPSRCVELTLKHPVETTSRKRVQVVADGENLLTASWVCYTYSLCRSGKGGRWRNSNYIMFFLFPSNKTGLSRLKISMGEVFRRYPLDKMSQCPKCVLFVSLQMYSTFSRPNRKKYSVGDVWSSMDSLSKCIDC